MVERTKFEAWVVEHFCPTTDYATSRDYDGIYYGHVAARYGRGASSEYASVQMLWEAWQAAVARSECREEDA